MNTTTTNLGVNFHWFNCILNAIENHLDASVLRWRERRESETETEKKRVEKTKKKKKTLTAIHSIQFNGESSVY